MDEPKRGPGRPPKIKPIGVEGYVRVGDVHVTRPQTAQERIDEIRLMEYKGNGFIVPRPAELTIGTFRQWMRETAEIGSGDHVALVWQYGNQSMDWRNKLLNEYHALQRQAGERWGKLLDEAKADKQKADAEYQTRTQKANKQRAIAQAEARLAALKAAG